MSCEDFKTDQRKNYQENRTEQLSTNYLTLIDIPVLNVHRGKSNNAFLLVKVENCISRTGRVQAEPVSLLLPPCCRALYCEFSDITIMRPLVLLHIIILCAPGQQCNNQCKQCNKQQSLRFTLQQSRVSPRKVFLFKQQRTVQLFINF